MVQPVVAQAPSTNVVVVGGNTRRAEVEESPQCGSTQIVVIVVICLLGAGVIIAMVAAWNKTSVFWLLLLLYKLTASSWCITDSSWSHSFYGTNIIGLPLATAEVTEHETQTTYAAQDQPIAKLTHHITPSIPMAFESVTFKNKIIRKFHYYAVHLI